MGSSKANGSAAIQSRYRSIVEEEGADPNDWAYAWRSELNRGGFKAVDFLMREIVDTGKCVGCAACVTICPTDVFDYVDERPVDARDEACVHCVLCADVCPSLRPPDPDQDQVIGLREPLRDDGYGPFSYEFLARSRQNAMVERTQDGGFTSELLIHLLERGEIARRYEIVDGAGRLLQEVDLSAFAGEIGPMVLIPRTGLIEILRGAARGADLRMGTTIRDLEQRDGGPVGATFSDGASAEFDVVLGCDGMHSPTRTMVFGASPDVLDTHWTL